MKMSCMLNVLLKSFVKKWRAIAISCGDREIVADFSNRCLIDQSSKTSQVYPDILKGKGDSFKDEFEKWMEMKVKLKLMPLNGIDIPKVKPPVPPLPKNLHQVSSLAHFSTNLFIYSN